VIGNVFILFAIIIQTNVHYSYRGIEDRRHASISHTHWVQSKRHRLWFSTKTCSCYSTKTHINSVILILRLNLTSLRNIITLVHKNVCGAKRWPLLMYMFLNEVNKKIEDEDHTVNITFRWVTTTLFLLRTTTCDSLFVPSDTSPCMCTCILQPLHFRYNLLLTICRFAKPFYANIYLESHSLNMCLCQ